MKAFTGVNLLAVEAASKTVGSVIAKLHEGMIQGGMSEFNANYLITEAFRIFITSMNLLYGPNGPTPGADQ